MKDSAMIRVAVALSLAAASGVASADQVFADDVIVTGSECVGLDCVNNESFGFDTLRLKENNTRITFTDTSNSSGFATRDWTLVANDSASGGPEYFGIYDVDSARTVFSIAGGARSNALVVDSGGDLGLGTSSAVLDIHVAAGDTPGLRLDQDGSGGYAAQVWDMAGNEANFFVRDVTGGSQLPFRIYPGADTSSLVINANNSVGIGSNATATLNDGSNVALNIYRSDGDATMLVQEASSTQASRDMLELRNKGNPQLALNNTANGNVWRISGGQNLVMMANTTAPSAAVFKVSPTGDLTLSGKIYTSASCAAGCDRVFAAGYVLDSIADHAQKMWSMSHLPAIGATDEQGQFNLTDMAGGMLNELEKAHIYIAELNQRLVHSEAEAAQREQTIESQREEIDSMRARLERIEAQLSQQTPKL